jgi:hypothetical protein
MAGSAPVFDTQRAELAIYRDSSILDLLEWLALGDRSEEVMDAIVPPFWEDGE